MIKNLEGISKPCGYLMGKSVFEGSPWVKTLNVEPSIFFKGKPKLPVCLRRENKWESNRRIVEEKKTTTGEGR